MKRVSAVLALFALVQPIPAQAAALTVTKTASVISDPLGNAAPKSLPGAVVDYKVMFTNPLGNLLSPVRNILVTDVLPTNVSLRVSDLNGTGSGPVEFNDGSLLGLGLLGSGLTCAYTSLASTTDCIDFSSDGGTTWTYTPAPDANGYDPNVRAIRIKPLTTFAAGGSFQLRYRVKIR